MHIKAGERTRILRMFSSSIPSTINFVAISESGEVSGTVEVDRWHWFSWQKETLPLQAQNAVAKGFADADFIIHVTPDRDCEIVFGRKTGGAALVLILLIAVLIIGVAVAMFAFTAQPPG